MFKGVEKISVMKFKTRKLMIVLGEPSKLTF